MGKLYVIHRTPNRMALFFESSNRKFQKIMQRSIVYHVCIHLMCVFTAVILYLQHENRRVKIIPFLDGRDKLRFPREFCSCYARARSWNSVFTIFITGVPPCKELWSCWIPREQLLYRYKYTYINKRVPENYLSIFT